MRKIVRNFDRHSDIRTLNEKALDLDPVAGAPSRSEEIEVGQFVEGPDGWLAVVRAEGASWALLRRGELNNLSLVEVLEVIPTERREVRELQIRFSGGQVWTFRYEPADPVIPSEDDPTPFVADEHFDFALHLRRLTSKSTVDQL